MGREFDDGGDRRGDGTRRATVAFEGYDTSQSTYWDAKSQELVKSGLLPAADDYLLLLQQAQAELDKSGAANPVTDSAPPDGIGESSGRSSTAADLSGKDTVAWGPNDLVDGIKKGVESTTKAVVNDAWDNTIEASEAFNRYFQGSNLNVTACDQAYKAFGLDKMGIDKNLVAGLIWNEELHRKPVVDDAQDVMAKAGLPQGGGRSIGPGQIQIANIHALANKYPQLQQFGDPIKAALKPDKAPFFVAAYLANEAGAIGSYNKQHAGNPEFKPIPITSETLAYRYNPDVYKDQSGIYRSLEPEEKLALKANQLHGVIQEDWPISGVVEKSHHVIKVQQAMQELIKHQ